jgi:hypothetical protein
MSPDTAEATRQQQFLHALWAGTTPAGLRPHDKLSRGLTAYRAHGLALAERALAAVFPTVQQVVGADAFANLARSHWQKHPPTQGDVALWGDSLPSFLAHEEALRDEPYLPDLARLEWAVHVADRAQDGDAAPQGLPLLAAHDPAQLGVQLAAGMALVPSRYPIVRIWQAHRRVAEDRFDAVRAAFLNNEADHALVWRQGWRVQVKAVAAAEARFTQALLAGRSLGAALLDAGDDFSFEPWLISSVQQQRLWAVLPQASVQSPMQESSACSIASPSPH